MKIVWSISLFLLCFAFNQIALTQDRLTTTEAIDFWVSNTEKEVTSAAAAMPEEKYSFAPVAGEFNGSGPLPSKLSTSPPPTIVWRRTCSSKNLHLSRSPNLDLIRFERRKKSWTTWQAHSENCIGRLPRSMMETRYHQFPVPPDSIRVFSLPLTRWPTRTITMGRWWNTCA